MTESLSNRNQSIDLLCKSMDWFLCVRDLHYEELISSQWFQIKLHKNTFIKHSYIKTLPKPSKAYNSAVSGLHHRGFPGDFPKINQKGHSIGNHWTTIFLTTAPWGRKSHSQPLSISVHHSKTTGLFNVLVFIKAEKS